MAVAVVGGAAVLAAAEPPPLATQTYPSPVTDKVGGRGALNPDGGDRYTYTSSAGTLGAAALQGNRSSNLRMVMWPSRSLPRMDEQTCATWSDASDWSDQEGAALRIRRDASGAMHAVTVTKNVWLGATWIFNVHEWNSDERPAFHQIGQVNLRSVFRGRDGTPVPFPWRMCARVVGSNLDFKVWPSARAEPAWGDRRFGRRVALDAAEVQPGVAGWYLGHLRPGDAVALTDLGVWALDPSWSGSGLSSSSSTIADRSVTTATASRSGSFVVTRTDPREPR